jgi:hypothetical protein
VRRADHEDRLVHAARVDDENVTGWGHNRLTVWMSKRLLVSGFSS